MSRFFLKTAIPALTLLALGACQNYFIKPNVIPTGYKYQSDRYKTIPSARPVNLGYEYTEEQNAEILRSLRLKVAELLDQLEAENSMANKTVYVFTPNTHNAQNAAFDHVLREELGDRDYTFTNDEFEGLILGYSIKEPRELEEYVDFGNLNGEHRNDAHTTRMNEYERMIIELALMDGPDTIDVVRGVYNMPMYGYERDEYFHILKPAIGRQPDRFGKKDAQAE